MAQYQTSIALTGDSQEVPLGQVSATEVYIQNKSTGILYISFSADVLPANGVTLSPSGSANSRETFDVNTNSVWLQGAGTGTVAIHAAGSPYATHGDKPCPPILKHW
jgi:hypothetical protein